MFLFSSDQIDPNMHMILPPLKMMKRQTPYKPPAYGDITEYERPQLPLIDGRYLTSRKKQHKKEKKPHSAC